MIEEAIQKILDIAQRYIVEDDDRKFDSATLKPILAPVPDPIRSSSLQSVVDFLAFEFPASTSGLALLVDYNTVKVVSGLVRPEMQRRTYLSASAPQVGDEFDAMLSVEDTVVWLQNGFVSTEDRDKLLAIVSHIVAGTNIKVSDDGMTQTAEVKSGLALKDREGIQNPITLRPYQTFIEVDQPEVTCIVRLRGNEKSVQVTIKRADGGAWQIQARANISDWLKKKLPNMPIIA